MRTTLDVAAVTLVPLCARFVSISTPVPPFVDCAMTCHCPCTLAAVGVTGVGVELTGVETDPPPHPAMRNIAPSRPTAGSGRTRGIWQSRFILPHRERSGRTAARILAFLVK